MSFRRSKWRKIAVAIVEWTPPRPVLRMVATTDYCTRDHDGGYISTHLFRRPITVAAVSFLEGA